MEQNDVKNEVKNIGRHRVAVVFDNADEFEEFNNYAKSKSLDIKSFLKFAGRAYMVRIPLITGPKTKGTKSIGNAE